jgi:hypothetical protein
MPLGKVGRRRVSDETDRAIIAWNEQRCETQRHLGQKYELHNQILKAEVVQKSALEKALAALNPEVPYGSRLQASRYSRK